jgi:hypothetical protein
METKESWDIESNDNLGDAAVNPGANTLKNAAPGDLANSTVQAYPPWEAPVSVASAARETLPAQDHLERQAFCLQILQQCAGNSFLSLVTPAVQAEFIRDGFMNSSSQQLCARMNPRGIITL